MAAFLWFSQLFGTPSPYGFNPRRRSHAIAQQFLDPPDMIRQATGHSWSHEHFSPLALLFGGAPAQLMMGPAEIVGAAKQPHATVQRSQAPGRMSAFACETSEALAHGA